MGTLPPTRKRSSRACDGCKQRRMKCEDIMPSSTTNEPTCKLCRESGVDCTFETPVRKRGPAPGFRRPAGSPRGKGGSDDEGEGSADGGDRAPNGSGGEASSRKPAERHIAPPGRRRRAPLLGLPPALVDELLAVYFTHVHNVWPLIYKPMFNPHATSAPLLLAMLSIAACVTLPSGKDGLDSDKLFAMAESALHHDRTESRIDILQALMVLSLRQTGCGNKRSAFAYGGRASIMALNLGLHLAPSGPTDAGDLELRSRVYWNVYVLDKILAEETGRPFLLPYRRSSTAMPSTDEADEYEPWPPQTASSAPLPRSVRHVPPRRGHVMSFFVWTCRLGMLVEDILDLEVIGPPISHKWDDDYVTSLQEQHDVVQRAERIGKSLDEWRRLLPKHLDIDLSGQTQPLPHCVVGMAWYHCVKILLYSRFIKQRNPLNAHVDGAALAERAHRTCSESAEACVDLLAHLDRHKLLAQVSADVIHMLSIVTLFEAFDATDPDEALAHRAKVNFAQCCIWLRDFSASWPAASMHKVFFEGLIQGGLRISSGDLPPDSPEAAFSPATPSMPEELRVMGRNLATGRSASSVAGATPRTMTTPGSTGPGPSTLPDPGPAPAPGPSLFQLPQFYWNHLTTVPMEGGQGEPEQRADLDFEFDMHSQSAQGHTPEMLPPMPYPHDGVRGMHPSASDNLRNLDMRYPPAHPHANGSEPAFIPPSAAWAGAPVIGPHSGPQDQAAIYAALMSYMVEAAKTS
ncbi:uncharacterized protein CcaverHIS019_0403620 [Cutaneotrichosporon cavernicola]|uniref:Zn(2)-C6 fungal-type domain-containing protein n=1 Tax=Cutaneotrichosporon cavernicola TaxID=279322 RepID=A0AA48L405_9TREE|nr:uncharacterized protein CcaverHIS019_0403620 [Cutaneotrichosporon cavernicola]BEI91542.1 hypothetical protein CcaverHIS019_0403620 [Cutaneotrichosporon cavernicola]BEI99319.1 hypothetical protein CcaverHIS631_0403620 [Cutaneotrichosporon cavernicola]BEJ07095.1 hypothetical protein CcaverHIS641_0403640 [Cutaneotrichosporon cavernicola]